MSNQSQATAAQDNAIAGVNIGPVAVSVFNDMQQLLEFIVNLGSTQCQGGFWYSFFVEFPLKGLVVAYI